MSELYQYATAVHLYKPIIKRGVVDFAVSADWTPAAGDVKISIDGGGAANVTNLPVAIVMGNTAMWDYSLTSGEMTGKKIRITVADSATKAVEDQFFEIDTYGNASAQHAVNLNDAVRAGLTALINMARVTGTAQAGAAGTITLANGTTAIQASPGSVLTIISGTGAGQAGKIASVAGGGGSTPIATMNDFWPITAPNSTSVYQISSDDGVVPASAADIWTQATRTLSSAANLTSTGASIPLDTNGFVNADAQAINDVVLQGVGTDVNPWAPA
jgi:hypothetical protein